MQIQRIAAFTSNGTGGNPAGVSITAKLPTDLNMREAAAQIGYSETVFAAPAGDDSWRVRYFSPESEVPFCGHATIALGAALGQQNGPGTYHLILNEGEIDVEASWSGNEWVCTLRSLPTRSSVPDPHVVKDALDLFGYCESDLDPAIPPRLANAGADHLIIALVSRTALAAMNYDLSQGRRFMIEQGFVTIAFVFAQEPQLFYARNAFASGGVLEDPATGAAAAALAGMLRDLDWPHGGNLLILQGEDMGRGSRLQVEFAPEPGTPVLVTGATAAIEV